MLALPPPKQKCVERNAAHFLLNALNVQNPYSSLASKNPSSLSLMKTISPAKRV